MKIFPHVLIRFSGGAFERMKALELTRAFYTAGTIYHFEKKLADTKHALSTGIYTLIPRLEDRKIQNLLLNYRRDIFNERDIPQAMQDTLSSYLTEELKALFQDYLDSKVLIQELKIQGEYFFGPELKEAEKNFRVLAADEILQKGLLLSSQSLLKRIPGFLLKESPTNKKDFQTQRGLTKYISRMYCKTSPFSTFTNLAAGKLAIPDRTGAPFLQTPEKKKMEVVHHIRLNNFLYEYLQTLLFKNSSIYHHFLVRPNPSLEKGDHDYLFLVNSKNIEAFQRIPIDPVLEVFQDLTAEKKEGITFKDLVVTIVNDHYIDARFEEIEAYILQLIEYGFLEFDIGVSGIDPDWDLKLRKTLDNIDKEVVQVPLIKELSFTLERIRSLTQRYSTASCQERDIILKESFQLFKDICMKLKESAGLSDTNDPDIDTAEVNLDAFRHIVRTGFRFQPEQMFYEDTTINITPLLNEEQLNHFIFSLHGLLRQIRPFEWHWPERAQMKHFFLEKYGKNTPVDLMTFYEEYYREIKKPEAEWLKKNELLNEKSEKNSDVLEGNPFLNLPGVRKREQENSVWLRCFKSVLEKDRDFSLRDDEVFFSHDHLEHTCREYTRGLTGKPLKTGCSFGAFIQFYLEKQPDGQEKLKGVINSLFPGFGKLFSRFLPNFDTVITEDLRKWNESLAEDALLAEDCDASYFNANLHPPLLPYEIRIPGGHNSLPPSNQIPITQLQIRWDEKENFLHLIDKSSRKRVYVFDLGFQGHSGRSRLFQLLEKFTLAEYLYIIPLLCSITESSKGKIQTEQKKNSGSSIYINPRIVYDQCIVLQRKTWFIPREKLPGKEPGETQWCYFLRIDKWRRELRIPDEVYVYVADRRHIQASPPEKSGQELGRDDYKPQYISFANPFLIDLFEKLIKRVPQALKIEEMLPNSNQLLEFHGSRHITEFTVQWYDRDD